MSRCAANRDHQENRIDIVPIAARTWSLSIPTAQGYETPIARDFGVDMTNALVRVSPVASSRCFLPARRRRVRGEKAPAAHTGRSCRH